MKTESKTGPGSPLDDFSGCHEGIIANFNRLLELVAMIDEDAGNPRIAEIAGKLVQFFEEVVYTHHAEEEQELFAAVLDAADNGDEVSEARAHIERLVAEHRELESMWKQIEGDLWRLSRGRQSGLDRELAARLARRYLQHAEFEEQVFLPFSARLLSKTELSDLGLALHRRHEDKTAPFFI